jgi:hypothetical protein
MKSPNRTPFRAWHTVIPALTISLSALAQPVTLVCDGEEVWIEKENGKPDFVRQGKKRFTYILDLKKGTLKVQGADGAHDAEITSNQIKVRAGTPNGTVGLMMSTNIEISRDTGQVHDYQVMASPRSSTSWLKEGRCTKNGKTPL